MLFHVTILLLVSTKEMQAQMYCFEILFDCEKSFHATTPVLTHVGYDNIEQDLLLLPDLEAPLTLIGQDVHVCPVLSDCCLVDTGVVHDCHLAVQDDRTLL